jgi:hypothetical protein
MALIIKSLAHGRITQPKQILYTAPTGSPLPRRAAIVKSLRFVNAHAGANATINVLFKPSGSAEPNGYHIFPMDLVLAPKQMVVQSEELTLAPGDQIVGIVTEVNRIEYVISGVERDESEQTGP